MQQQKKNTETKVEAIFRCAISYLLQYYINICIGIKIQLFTRNTSDQPTHTQNRWCEAVKNRLIGPLLLLLLSERRQTFQYNTD